MKITNGALTASLLGVTAMAFAQSQPRAVPGHIVISASDVAAARAYWTADRMAHAKAMPLPQVDPATASLNASPPAPDLPQVSVPGRLLQTH